jgi:hypothetical protein
VCCLGRVSWSRIPVFPRIWQYTVAQPQFNWNRAPSTINGARACASGCRAKIKALARSDLSRPNLAPGPTSTFTAHYRPTTRIPPRRPRLHTPDLSKRCIVVADPESLPLDTPELHSSPRTSLARPVTMSTSVGVNVRLHFPLRPEAASDEIPRLHGLPRWRNGC